MLYVPCISHSAKSSGSAGQLQAELTILDKQIDIPSTKGVTSRAQAIDSLTGNSEYILHSL